MSLEGNVNDTEYRAFLQRVSRRFQSNVTAAGFKVFRTDADPAALWEGYLNSFADPVERQHHNCNTCRHFIQRFGGLVTIEDDGSLTPAIWDSDDADPQYAAAIAVLQQTVRRAKVTGVFKSSEAMLGHDVTDNLWRHLSVTQPPAMVHTDRTKTAFQAEAEKLQEYYTLVNALQMPEYAHGNLQTVLTLLNSGQLYRGDKYINAARWLIEVVELTKERGLKGYHLAWRKIASAPAGFTKPRGTALGTLIEDVHANLPFAEIKRKFESMLDPETYQRAQAAPAAGAVVQAEKLFEQLGLAPALPRRFAKMSEVLKLWEPKVLVHKASAVGLSTFGHIMTKDQERQAQASQVPTLEIPATVMTWEKFAERVLPTATAIELLVPESNRFMALTTAENADAPPILKWDDDKQRNPVAWYYDSGADAEVRERVTRAGGMYEGVDIRVSLIWNNTDDLDLHVVTPRGDHIGFSNKRACRHGGYLDVDMNIRGETTKPVENIRWARGQAPSGDYRIYVNNYRNRGPYGKARITPFMVEIEVAGNIRQFHGEICRQGEYSPNPAMLIATLGYLAGTAPKWSGGQAAQAQWTSAPNTFSKVKAITQSPNLWGGRTDMGNGDHTFFLLEGCEPVDLNTGRGLFPEMLRSELHPVRSVIEAYSKQSTLGGEPETCGVGMVAGKPWNVTLKVTGPGGTAMYKIDRKE